jgi:hypothetical protein
MKNKILNMGLGAMAMLAVCCGVLAADNPDVSAHDAWIRLPSASRTETAAYMVIENKGTTARSVVSATSADAAKIELHEMKMGGGMMSMSPVAKIDVPAKGKATLAPNGYHLMVFGLKSKLADGGKFTVTLKLDDGSTVPVTASVRKPE